MDCKLSLAFTGLALLAGLLTSVTAENGTYLVTFPNTLQRGMPFKIHVNILNASAPVHVKADLQVKWNYTWFSSMMIESDFRQGLPGILVMTIPMNVYSRQYAIQIRGTNGLQFERRTHVNRPWKAVSIFIQTDKAVYKPSQKVLFRAFAIFPNMKIYTGRYDIILKDPHRNTLKRWIDVWMNNSSGVTTGSFQLADQALLGGWTITVKARNFDQSKTKEFTVDEYQLPRFEVKLDLPAFAVTSDKLLSGTVKATYTFGKPVKGMVEMQAYIKRYRGPCAPPPRTIKLGFPIDGSSKFSFPVSDLSRLGNSMEGHNVEIIAIVKEDLTGVKQNGTGSVQFYKHPYKIEFLRSSPRTFSPKLPYTAFIMVSSPDGTPISDAATLVRVFTTVNYEIHNKDSSQYDRQYFRGNYGIPPQNYTVPQSGIVTMEIRTPENTSSINMKAHYRDVSATLSVNKKNSDSDSYLQLKLVNKDLKSGQIAIFSLEFTETVPSFAYQILSRGATVISNHVTADSASPVIFHATIPATLAPVAHIVAYYVRHTGEIVADSLAFNVDEVFENKVSIEFSRKVSKPHENIDVLMSADPQSSFNILAVDQSVLLVKSGNDISQKQVEEELKTYSVGTSWEHFTPEVMSISSSSTEARSVFRDAGLIVITDAKLQSTRISAETRHFRPAARGFNGADEMTNFRFDRASYDVSSVSGGSGGFGGSGGSGGLQKVGRVRSVFPETWLWSSHIIGADGKANISTRVPDTITSWVATAFAVNHRTGLGISPSSANLRVFKPFFVSLSMPTSILRGEQVVIQASVFNYLPTDLDVQVVMRQSKSYMNVVVDRKGKTSWVSKDQVFIVKIQSNKPHTVYLPIIPMALGSIDVEVSARSTMAADAVRRQLHVQAEGIPREYNTALFVDLLAVGTNFTKTVPIPLPAEVTPKTARVEVKVTGDLIGASLDNLENLLALPTGCGEQNMMTFAPDVYIADYLTTTKQMTPGLNMKIRRFLDLGYQRQLTYQRTDGSFSPFGERDEAGSMWLTAFVTRTFHQSRPHIYVDDKLLVRALGWMTSRQNLDGSFSEPGLVLDHMMQRSDVVLTSMVLLALVENLDLAGNGTRRELYGNATVKARHYLEAKTSFISDTFTLAVVTYTLSMAESRAAGILLIRLKNAAQFRGDEMFWIEPTVNNTYFTKWTPPHVRAQPIDIQITAYGLLALSAKGDLRSGLRVIKWLNTQRNPRGGFASTQDTIMAIQAMSDYATRTRASGYQIQINIQSGKEVFRASINDKNALVLQTFQMPLLPDEVVIVGNGLGVALVEVDVFFNVNSEIGTPAFDVNTVLLDDTLNFFTLMTCSKWLKKKSSGMVVMEISIPSGFEPDVTSIGNVAGLKRVDKRGRIVSVYFDKIGRTSTCFSLTAIRTNMVLSHQQSYITVHDYYQPSNQASVFYLPNSLKTASICDICERCCFKI